MLSRLSDSLSAFNWIPKLRMFCCCCELYSGMRFMSILLALIWIVNAFESFMWRNPNLLVGPFLVVLIVKIIWGFNAILCCFVFVAIERNNRFTIALAFYLQLLNILCLAILTIVSLTVSVKGHVKYWSRGFVSPLLLFLVFYYLWGLLSVHKKMKAATVRKDPENVPLPRDSSFQLQELNISVQE